LDGFSGATPYEICERYAAGMIDRERLVDELARYPYVPTPRTESLADDLLMTPPGTWADVCDADRRGLIPEDVYGEVMARQDALGL
jgi:hypothetical protein